MPIKGFVDGFHAGYCVGWAREDAAPDLWVDIEIWNPAGDVVSGVAELFRPDLLNAGYGTGTHAFQIDITQLVGERDPRSAELRVFARSPLGNMAELKLSATAVHKAVSAPTPKMFSVDEPIFIIGAARSGTSALYSALVESKVAIGDGEGHFFPLLLPLQSTVAEYYRRSTDASADKTTLAKISAATTFATLCDGLRTFMRGRFDGHRWVDKTPTVEMIEASPILLKIWPAARFIFMKRRGIENILSRERKFRGAEFAELCQDWSTVMHRWAALRSELGASYLEIDQALMQTDARGVSEHLAAFLGLDEAQERQICSFLTSESVEMTAPFNLEPISLQETPWTVAQRESFVEHCGAAMEAFGYTI
jgi:hypothetical protein